VLTPAEWRVAEAVRHGLSNRQIAERQGVSLDAVKFHVGNTLQKLALSNRVELRHWTGIRHDSIVKSRRTDVNELLELGRIGQIARTVTDIGSAKQWYGDVLGLKHLYSFDNIAFFDCGGTRLFLFEGDDPSGSIIYFQVPDIHQAHSNLIQRGIEFINAPHMVHRHPDGTEEWMAFFKDNENRPLAIMAQATPLS
jgi:DNA-binding CsgD family transcriptional regulator/catechol 2,3-dioxygenase-like lactoylglutathione lyase family enzyme